MARDIQGHATNHIHDWGNGRMRATKSAATTEIAITQNWGRTRLRQHETDTKRAMEEICLQERIND